MGAGCVVDPSARAVPKSSLLLLRSYLIHVRGSNFSFYKGTNDSVILSYKHLRSFMLLDLEAGRRGKQGLSDWSDIARRKPSVDLKVGARYVAAIARGDCGARTCKCIEMWGRINTYGTERLLQFQPPHRTCPSEGAPASCRVSPSC